MKSDNSTPELHVLHDAFDVLEQRADAARVSPLTVSSMGRVTRRWGVRVLAPVGAAAVVAAAAVAVALWPHSSSTPSDAQAGASAAAPIIAASDPATSTSPSASASPSHAGHYLPPQTGRELAAKTRAILDGIATLKIDPEALAKDTDANPQPVISPPNPAGSLAVVRTHGNGTAVRNSTPSAPTPQSAPAHNPDDGSAIYGTLTSAEGHSGGFLLNVYATTPPLTADCSGDAGNECTVTRQSDGTSVAVGRWHDRSVPGGITDEVTAVRPDGAEISILLSTEADPKGESTVRSQTLPLTVAQLVDFVTSEQW